MLTVAPSAVSASVVLMMSVDTVSSPLSDPNPIVQFSSCKPVFLQFAPAIGCTLEPFTDAVHALNITPNANTIPMFRRFMCFMSPPFLSLSMWHNFIYYF
jgi:hypothetical protein